MEGEMGRNDLLFRDHGSALQLLEAEAFRASYRTRAFSSSSM